MGEGVGAKGREASSPTEPSEQKESGINRSEPASERDAPARERVGEGPGRLPAPPPSQAWRHPPRNPSVRRHPPPTPSPWGASGLIAHSRKENHGERILAPGLSKEASEAPPLLSPRPAWAGSLALLHDPASAEAASPGKIRTRSKI